MTNNGKPFDPVQALAQFTEIRRQFDESMSEEDRELLRDRPPGKGSGAEDIFAASYTPEKLSDAMHDFDAAALLDEVQRMAEDVQYLREQKLEKVYRTALEVYYAAEEIANDPNHPEHAAMVKQVEAMRASHQRDYGRPIPPKGTK